MVYDVNVAPISPKLGTQLLDFLSKLGYYKTDGNDDFECTTSMVDFIVENVNSGIATLTTLEKVDLGMALMIIPIPPALELVNKCLEHVSETEFKVACHDLAVSTDYFEKYENYEIEFIDGSNFAIGIIVRYLHPMIGKMQKCEKEFRKKFQEITKQISKDMYGPGSYKSTGSDTLLPWTNIQLTTCGATGRAGPSLKDCIATYNSDRSKNKHFFDVDPNREGIQKIRIARSGNYQIKAWGAGNHYKTGSGNVSYQLQSIPINRYTINRYVSITKNLY